MNCNNDNSTNIDNFVGKLNRQSVLVGSAVLMAVGVTYFLYRSNRSNVKDKTNSKR